MTATRARRRRPAKVTRPRVSRALERPRLFRLIDRGWSDGARVVWVVAAPGSGKTTLGATYVSRRRAPGLWYSLDAADADLATFFHHLAAAAPRRRPPLPALTLDRRPGLEVFTRRFFEQLAARLPPRAMLVLDSYQEVDEGAELHGVLTQALGSLAPRQRLLVLSRAAPPPAFARLEVAGELYRLDERELRLTAREAAALARLRRCSGADVRALHERTQGWVAGLVLLLEHGEARFGTPSVLAQYLASEFLDRLPESTRALLLRAAFPPRVTPAMLEALGGAGAVAAMADLARRGAFVTHREGPSYELHPLVRELCLERASAMAELAPSRALAARLTAEAGELEAAVEIYAAMGALDEVAALVRAHALSLQSQGRIATLAGWLARLPPERDDGWLSYWRGACVMHGDPSGARASFQRAFDAFSRAGDATGQHAAFAGALESIVYLYDDMRPLDPWIDAFDAIEATPSPIFAQALASMIAACNYRRFDHPRLPELRPRALALIETSASTAGMLLGYVTIANAFYQGDLLTVRRGSALLRAALRQADTPPLYQIFGRTIEAFCSAGEGDHARCRAAVTEGLELARVHGIPLWELLLHIIAAYDALACDDLSRAEPHRVAIAARLLPIQRINVFNHGYVECWAALVAGDARLAVAHAKDAVRAAHDAGASCESLAQLALAAAQAELGDHAAALEALAATGDFAERYATPAVEAPARLVHAQLALARGDELDARRHLAAAFGAAREIGLGLLVLAVMRPATLGRLAAAALAAEIEVDTVRALLRLRPVGDFTPPVELRAWPWHVEVQLLGRFVLHVGGKQVRFPRKAQRRPLELLQLLVLRGGSGVPEAEIADELWPDADGDRAERALKVALHRLRTILGDGTLIERQSGTLSLDRRRVAVDLWALEQRLARAEAPPEALGALLPGNVSSWAAAARQRLEARLARRPRQTA
jgi:LuxR family maltose regulon positive regulatory protein